MQDIQTLQRALCQKYNAGYYPLDLNLKLGISTNFFSGALPLNGLRLPPEGALCGWFLWAGEELSDADDFFQPLHAYHLLEYRTEVVRYLALPPGWRFLVAGDYEDVWYDEQLLSGTNDLPP